MEINNQFLNTMMCEVQLRAAKIPGLPGYFADHYWLLVINSSEGGKNQTCDRWEIWQTADQNETCWGHLHKNLLLPFQGVGNGPSKLVHQWFNQDAKYLIYEIESSPSKYPFLNNYRYWPGPNSNTYAQWIVRKQTKLGLRAIGKDFQVPQLNE